MTIRAPNINLTTIHYKQRLPRKSGLSQKSGEEKILMIGTDLYLQSLLAFFLAMYRHQIVRILINNQIR